MRNLPKLLIALCALLCPALAFGQSGVRWDGLTLSPSGKPVSASVAVCNSPGLLTTGAQVIGNTAILTFATSPITAGFAANMSIAVSGFTGGDVFFNVGTLQPFSSTVTISAVSATTITFPLTHANTSASSNGSVFQMGNIAQACAPLASIFSDSNVSVPITQPGFVSSNIGNVGFYVNPGQYAIQYYGTGITTYLQPLTLTMVFLNGNNTLTGTDNFTGPVSACVLNGLIYVSTGGCYTTLAQAYAACVAPNCTIDMRGASAATTLGNFDPGVLSVTIYLGPYTYSLTQMIVRSGLHLIGMGSNITLINQANAGTAPFVLPPAGGTYPANVAIHALFKGFNLQAAVSSTTDAFSMIGNKDAGGTGGGIWYSSWEDINIGSTASFGRNAIRIDTTENLTASPTGANQFLSFKDVFAFRVKNAPPDLFITGSFSGQISFVNCQFDGQQGQLDTNANTYNIRVDDGGTAFVPYSISMRQVTSQWAWGVGSAAIFLGGVVGFDCLDCHFENDNGVIKEAVGAGGHGNWGIAVHQAYMTSNVAVNAGNGFLADLGTQNGLDWSDNAYFGTPDATFLGTLTYLHSGTNWNASSGLLQPWTQINMGLGITVANLPAVAANPGKQIYVTDSSAIAAEGQTCVGGGAVKALAFSNGSVWKCF